MAKTLPHWIYDDEYCSLFSRIIWHKLTKISNCDFTKFNRVILKNYDYIYGDYIVDSELRRIKRWYDDNELIKTDAEIKQFFNQSIYDHGLIINLNDKKLTNCWVENNNLILLFTRPPKKSRILNTNWQF
jgi:hypothetical protein